MRRSIIPFAVALSLLGFVQVGGRAQEHDDRWVEERVASMMHTPPQAWTEIPWVGSLAQARRFAQQERRPIFLFTEDGDLSTGRC
jgi:hypothetical protein